MSSYGKQRNTSPQFVSVNNVKVKYVGVKKYSSRVTDVKYSDLINKFKT